MPSVGSGPHSRSGRGSAASQLAAVLPAPGGDFRAPHRKSLRAELRGSVAIVAAIGVTVLIYAAAIAIDLANLYYIKSEDQRIADQSAIAAAFAYESSGSTVTVQKEAASLALANGSGSATVTAAIVNAPSGDGNLAAYVTVTSPVLLSGFGRFTTETKTHPAGTSSFTASGAAYAEIHGAPPCILATQTSNATGITAYGGARIAATSCDIASNSSITLSNGPTFTATVTEAVGSISLSGGAVINGTQAPNSSRFTDPYLPSGDTASPVFSRFQNTFFTYPSAPSFPSMPSAPSGTAYQTCSSGTLTLAGNASYGGVSNSGSCSLIKFSGGGTTSIAYIALTDKGVNLSFGAGTYKIGGIGITSSSGSVTATLTGSPTFYLFPGQYGASSLSVGANVPVTFAGSATWYIDDGITYSGSSSLAFTDTGSTPSNFTIAGGISVTGGSVSFPNGTYTLTSVASGNAINVNNSGTLTMGNGSFIIADGIDVGSSDKMTIGSALDANSVFQIPTVSSGYNAITTGGSSMLSIGSFNNLDINGAVVVSSSLNLAGGILTVNGAFDATASGGGSITGTNVSIVASGPVSFGQGFNAVAVNAPTGLTGATEGTAGTVILASNSGSGSTITQGATNTQVVGAVYFPSAGLAINGGGNLTGGGNCLQVIAQSISMSGSGSITTNCSSLGTGVSIGSVTLVE